jgi:hypothetical protein
MFPPPCNISFCGNTRTRVNLSNALKIFDKWDGCNEERKGNQTMPIARYIITRRKLQTNDRSVWLGNKKSIHKFSAEKIEASSRNISFFFLLPTLEIFWKWGYKQELKHTIKNNGQSEIKDHKSLTILHRNSMTSSKSWPAFLLG